MQVKLISITKPEFKLDSDGKIQDSAQSELTPEQLIVFTARVSNPGNQYNHGTADKLIAYLVRNKLWSPFEMVDMTVEIKTSRAIAQQILRHRSFSFQEFSQRYAEVADMEPVQIRKQADSNRQSSTESIDPTILGDIIDSNGNYYPGGQLSTLVEQHLSYCQALYASMLRAGVAKECARMVLPLTTQTTIYMKGSVRSWIHYLQQRLDPHTQLEHRQVANQILSIFEVQFPNIAMAIVSNTHSNNAT